MSEYELISYQLIGAPQLSEDGQTVKQNVNAVSNQIGNTYSTRYVTNTVIPTPSFALADAAKAPEILKQACIDFIKKTYPNT